MFAGVPIKTDTALPTGHRFHNDMFQHSELLKITTSADLGRKGVSRSPERKNPGSAFWGTPTGVLV
jgi:hypothetical protein